MTKAVFMHFCECQFQIFGIPIRIYKDVKLITKLDHMILDRKTPTIMDDHIPTQMIASSQDVQYSLEHPMLSYGMVRCKKTGYAVVLGPSRSLSVESTLTDSIIKQYNLPPDIVRSISQYISLIPIMQISRFINILSSFSSCLNGDIIDVNNFCEPQSEYLMNKAVYKDLIEHSEKITFEEIEKYNHSDFEKNILFYIKNGMTSHLKSLWHENFSKKVFAFNKDTLRLTKNNCIMSVGIITLTALSAGLNAEDVFKLREVYMQQAEMCSSVQEVLKLRFNIMIDFSERIRNMHYRLTTNPIINRVINYIVDNAKDKLSLADIAKHVNTNKTYLCTKFKEETGIGVAEFINLQKVNEAKLLLKFTDKSLVEISNYLSFSSQSYFQKIFKSVTELTPSEFKHKDIAD